jgi:hypothetical protein
MYYAYKLTFRYFCKKIYWVCTPHVLYWVRPTAPDGSVSANASVPFVAIELGLTKHEITSHFVLLTIFKLHSGSYICKKEVIRICYCNLSELLCCSCGIPKQLVLWCVLIFP